VSPSMHEGETVAARRTTSTKRKTVSKQIDGELARLEAEAYDASPSHLDLVERSRLYLVNVVRDEIVAEFGSDRLGQGPSMLMVLMLCHGVFLDSDALYEALLVQPWSRAAWLGKKKNIRPVYARIGKKLEDTLFCLAHDGLYGFWLRADSEQRMTMIERRDVRIARVRRAARAARHPDVTGALPNPAARLA
jgi:hypothetical protein